MVVVVAVVIVVAVFAFLVVVIIGHQKVASTTVISRFNKIINVMILAMKYNVVVEISRLLQLQQQLLQLRCRLR